MDPDHPSIPTDAVPHANATTDSRAKGIRVAFFSDSLPERNGTGAYYHDLASHLNREVQALEIFQPVTRGQHPLLSLPMPGDPMQRLVTPNVFRIFKGYKQLAPHIVVSITPGPFGLLGLAMAKLHRAQFITAFHTDFEHLARIYFNPFSRRLANGYLRTANRILCKSSRTVLINNTNLRKEVTILGASGTDIMGTPLQPAFLEKPIKPVPTSIRRICFAGRLAVEKNVDLILDAARSLNNIEFVIGGDGPLRRQLEATAQGLKNVRFTGWLSRTDLIDLLDSSSLLLLPSKLETFGSVALEAMARGRPALVSANAGIHDWPQLKGGLFSLQPGEDVATAIGKLVPLTHQEWQEKAILCRSAAEQLNNETIGQWANLLAKYAAPTKTHKG